MKLPFHHVVTWNDPLREQLLDPHLRASSLTPHTYDSECLGIVCQHSDQHGRIMVDG